MTQVSKGNTQTPVTRSASAAVSHVRARDETVQVTRDGDPALPTVVILHDVMQSAEWSAEFAGLLADFSVLRIDLLGHGGSTDRTAAHSPELQAAVLLDVIRNIDPAPRGLVGQGFGGAVAVSLAEQGLSADSLVLIGTAPDRPTRAPSPLMRFLLLPGLGSEIWSLLPDFSLRAVQSQSVKLGFELDGAFPHPAQAALDARRVRHRTLRNMRGGWERYVSAQPLDKRIGSLDIPVLALFGDSDLSLDVDACIRRYSALPNVDVRAIDAGNSPMLENSQASLVPIRDFLANAKRRTTRSPHS